MNIEGATLDETADDDRDSTSLIGRGSHRTGLARLKDIFFYSIIAKIIYVILLCLAIGLIGPFVINKYLEFSETKVIVEGTCHIQYGVRINCFPEVFYNHNVSKEDCEIRGCCYQKLNLATFAPVCHRKLPSVHTLKSSGTNFDGTLTPSELARVWPNQTLSDLKYSIRQVKEGQVSVLFFDEKHRPDIEIGANTSLSDLDISLTQSESDQRLALRMWRKSDSIETPLVDASFGSVLVTDRYSEISLSLPTGAIFGLGGHPFSFNSTETGISSNFTKKLFFNYDPDVNVDQQHNLPFFMYVDSERNFAGIVFETGGFPAEVEVLPGRDQLVDDNYINLYPLDQKPLLVFRSMSNFLAIHVLTGPKPKDVLLQLASYTGMPDMPQLWSLGLHMCRRTNSDSQDFNENLKQMADNFLPFDSDCLSENILRSSFEPSNAVQLPQDLLSLESAGKKFLLKVPPHTENTPAFLNKGFFIMNSINNDTYKSEYGTVKETVLPDFTHPNTSKWFEENLKNLMAKFSVKPAGIATMKNSPFSKTQTECSTESFQFIPNGAFLSNSSGLGTICADSLHYGGRHFEIHNSYSKLHEDTLANSLIKLGHAPMIFNTHSHMKSTKSSLGSHFKPSWINIKQSLREVLELGLSGSQFVSMEACGFDSSNSIRQLEEVEELCLRWYQLASFMPGLHTFRGVEDISRLPYSFEKKTHITWTKRALQKRMKLSPYYYAQMYLSHYENALPLVRPLFMEFPDDQKLLYNYILKDQFMVGDAIMVTPVLDPGVSLLSSYFPQLIWYELWSGLRIQGGGTLESREVILPETPAYLKSGKIIPILNFNENDGPTSIVSSFDLFNYTLVVALSCQDLGPRTFNENCTAEGDLLLHHDGSNIFSPEKFMLVKISAKQDFVKADVIVSSGSLWPGCSLVGHIFIDKIIVFGARAPDEILQLEFDSDQSRLEIDNLEIDVCSNVESNLHFSWNLAK